LSDTGKECVNVEIVFPIWLFDGFMPAVNAIFQEGGQHSEVVSVETSMKIANYLHAASQTLQ